MNKKQYNKLVAYIKANNGATIDKSGAFVSFDCGYIVSKKDYEKTTKIEALTLAVVNKYLIEAKKHGLFVGFWLDKGVLYLDLNNYIKNKRVAISQGVKQQQIAIFDCGKKTSLYL